jgi:multicomponent Na+:H+ antiporter subunit D
MSIPLPLFIALPLAAAFLLPLFGTKGRNFASFFGALTMAVLLVCSIFSFGRFEVYSIGRWSIPLGINLVLDGISALMLLTISIVSFAAVLFSNRYMEQYTAKSKYFSLFMLMVAGMNGVVLSGDIFNLFVFLEIASFASYALVGFGC